MTQTSRNSWLDRKVDDALDHMLGSPSADLTLVEYGSYACPHCRAANDRIADLRDQFGERLSYVFRHRPLTGSDLARRAADLAERAITPQQFWDVHIALMTRSKELTEDDLRAVAEQFNLQDVDASIIEQAKQRVDRDIESSRASGVLLTPTFFINNRRYEGAWDTSALTDALLGSLGHRVRTAALDFARWAPSTGVLLLLATVVAIVLSNSMLGSAFTRFWETPFGLSMGEGSFAMPLRLWVNDALLTLFFLVVGLEIKREFTVGHLAGLRAAALPIAAAVGGMVVPASLYVLLISQDVWAHGWGVPMATDTAFAIALIAMLGSKVPVELRIFLTAAAIVDDIGAIVVVAIFYSGEIHLGSLGMAALVVLALALLNRAHVYRASPYLLLGIALWIFVHESGLHATLAGVVLAMFIPTRPPANLHALNMQATAILTAEASRAKEVLRGGPSEAAMNALDTIHDRLESPADRMLRHAGPRSSYIVLPIFALANAGVVISADSFAGNENLMLAIIVGLVIGKPLGIVLASWLAVRSGLAVKPDAYSWLQLTGAGALAGIGFTMSLFIADQAFSVESHFAAAKIAVFAASVLASLLGVALLSVRAREQPAIASSPARP